MSFFRKKNDTKNAILLDIHPETREMTTYLALKFNFGQITVKYSDIHCLTEELIGFNHESGNGTVRLNPACKEKVHELLVLLKDLRIDE